MSALRGMAAILAGVGTGMVSAREENERKARQAKQDAWLEEQRNRQRQDWQEADAVKAGIKDASATRELATGTVTEAGGQKLFSADPGQAAQVKSMVDSIAELEGSAPATQTGGYAVTGQMSKGHQIGTGAAPDVATLNTPDAESQRVQDVYRKAGMRDKAMAEFTANEAYKKAIRERIKTMETEGVGKALAMLRMGAPEQAMEAFQKSGSVKLPEGSKFVQVDGTDMHTGQPGKVWSVVGPDGKTIVADVGFAVAQHLDIADQYKFDGDLAKNRQAQINADREYGLKLADLEIRANEAKSKQEERALRAEIAQLRASRGGGSGGSGGGAATSGQPIGLPDPMAGFDSKKAYAAAVEMATNELSQSRQPATSQAIAQRATSIYRGLESEFQNTGARQIVMQAFERTAATATTPQEIATVYQRGMQAGLTPAEMAAIDPRFAPKVDPKQEPQKPQGSGLMERMFGGGKPSQPAYKPPAGSPAARAAESRANAVAARQQEQDALVQAARSAARAALASKDIAAAAQAQDMPGFRMLTDQEKLAVRGLVFGR